MPLMNINLDLTDMERSVTQHSRTACGKESGIPEFTGKWGWRCQRGENRACVLIAGTEKAGVGGIRLWPPLFQQLADQLVRIFISNSPNWHEGIRLEFVTRAGFAFFLISLPTLSESVSWSPISGGQNGPPH